MQKTKTLLDLPDVALNEQSNISYPIKKVGMQNVEVPIFFKNTENKIESYLAYLDLSVNLTSSEVKGIHMSRLYQSALDYFEKNPFYPQEIDNLLENLTQSQNEISSESFLAIHFKYKKQQQSLLSSKKGWRYYPLIYRFKKTNSKTTSEIILKITYSSTCPCSASLSKQLQKKAFLNTFKTQEKIDKKSIENWLDSNYAAAGYPHAQRSVATINLKFNQANQIPHPDILINEYEKNLKTTVQALVKRIDEQEFAKLNAQNLMFCEDAIRIIKRTCESMETICDYKIKVSHQESLHPHNAIAEDIKGIKNGYQIN